MDNPMEQARKTFLADVSRHDLTIEIDNGIHRSLLFQAPQTINQHFRVTTWTGHLCLSGDMGTYVWSRLRDMFVFFRNEFRPPYINPGYWAEKLEADCRCSGVMQFSAQKYLAAVRREMDDRGEMAGIEAMVPFKNAAEDGEARAMQEAIDRWPDFWENDVYDYTFHYCWCCYAVHWAIGFYDRRYGLLPSLG